MSSEQPDVEIGIRAPILSVRFQDDKKLVVSFGSDFRGDALYNALPAQLRPRFISAKSGDESANLNISYLPGINWYRIEGDLEQSVFADMIIKAQDLRSQALRRYVDAVVRSLGYDILNAGISEGLIRQESTLVGIVWRYFQESLGRRGLGHYLRKEASKFLKDSKRAQVVAEIAGTLEERIKDLSLSICDHEYLIEVQFLDIAVQDIPDEIVVDARNTITFSRVSETYDAIRNNSGLAFSYLMYHAFNNLPGLIELLQKGEISSVEQRGHVADLPRGLRLIRGNKSPLN